MKKFFLIAILLSVNTLTYAIEDVQKVYLNEAIQVALKNNIDLQAAKIDITIAKNSIKVANRLQNPSIESYYLYGGAGEQEPRLWGISQNIELAKRRARKNLAESNLKLVQKNVDYTTFDLKMDVREAYINLVAAKSILNTLEQQQALQEELLEIAKSRAYEKNDKLIDVIQVEIALNQLITQVNSAKVTVKNAISNFNKVINDPENTTYDSMDKLFSEENNFEEMLTPAPSENFPNISKFIDNAIKNRYDIQIAKQEIDIAEKNLTVVARQKIPDIKLSGGYAYLPGRYSSTGNYNSGAYLEASLANLPLFYNFEPEIKNAALKLQQAEIKYLSTKNKAIKDVNSAYERFLTACENLNHYETKIVKGSEELIDRSIETYEKGKTDITSLIVMKQSYKSIIIGYTQALSEYYNSWTNFLREVNDENFKLSESL